MVNIKVDIIMTIS